MKACLGNNFNNKPLYKLYSVNGYLGFDFAYLILISIIIKFPEMIKTKSFYTTKFILSFIAALISLIGFIMLVKVIRENTEVAFDQKVFNFLSQYVSNVNTAIMQVFTFFGSHKFLVPAWLFVFTRFYFLKNKWALIRATIIASSNLLLLFVLKYFFNRPRPLTPLLKEVPGLSFPSGHAYMSLIFFGLLIYFIYKHTINKWVKTMCVSFFLIIIFMIGISRIYLRLHYASDVLAGYCIGLFSLILHLWVIKMVENYMEKQRAYK